MVNMCCSQVFAECLVDPVTTIKKDILPRFLVGEDCRNMKALLGTHVVLLL